MAKKVTNKRAASPEDKKLGEKIRLLRNAAHVSQQELGLALNPPVSFQQIQKYEKGVNRVTATRLRQIASVLNVDASAFDETRGQGAKMSQELTQILGNRVIFEAAQNLARMKPQMRNQLCETIRTVAGARAA